SCRQRGRRGAAHDAAGAPRRSREEAGRQPIVEEVMKSPRRRWNRVLVAPPICSMGLALSIPPPLAGQMMTQQQRELQQAQENARGEQAMAAKRLEAFLRDEAMPHPCQLFVEWSPRLYAIAVGPAAEQTGLRRGD